MLLLHPDSTPVLCLNLSSMYSRFQVTKNITEALQIDEWWTMYIDILHH